MSPTDQVRIMFVGDISLGEYYTAFGHGPKTYAEHSNIFSGVQSILNQADIVAGNLETPITDHGYKPNLVETAVLRGNPKHAHQLTEAGFKVLQVSNNHSIQHGIQGFEETISILKNLGITPVGLQGQELTKLSKGSQKLGFLAASDVLDNTDVAQNCYQRLDEEFCNRIEASVKEVDHLFIMLHWGLEAHTKPMKYQRDLINKMANIGVRGIIGQHPHLFYPVWLEDNRTIAAPSLGNFVFDLFWDERLLKSAILDIKLTSSGLGECNIWPITLCRNSGRPIACGSPTIVDKEINLYKLGDNMNGEQSRKLKCFLKDYFKGNSALKAQFIAKKILGKI